jgi:NAD+ diphosphatase
LNKKTMLDHTRFTYCPRCGQARLQPNDPKSFRCEACGLVYYHSTSVAAVGLIEFEDKILLTRRLNEPKAGCISLPGGFVDYHETMEEALIREMQEELNLEISALRYLCSSGDEYLFREVTYFTIVAFFIARVTDISGITARDDISEFHLVRPEEIDPAGLAFDSDRFALAEYRKRKSN